MIRFVKELYFTMFTVGFRLRFPQRFGGGWGPDIDTPKGVVGVTLIEAVVLDGILGWVEIYRGAIFSFENAAWGPWIAFLVLFLPNYYVIITRGQGIKFEREFANLKKSRKVLLLVSCMVLLLGTIVFSIYSASAYRHFFNIIPNN